MTEPPQRPRIRVGTQTGPNATNEPSHQVRYQLLPPHPNIDAGSKESGRGDRLVVMILMAIVAVGLLMWVLRGPDSPYSAQPSQGSDVTVVSEEKSEPPATNNTPDSNLNLGLDIAGIARSRFLAEMIPNDVEVDLALFLEPGISQVAEESVTESVDHTLKIVGRYFNSSSRVVVVGMVTREWAIDVFDNQLDNSTGFASEVEEYLIDSDYGLAPKTCTGMGGFARTDYEQTVVIIDIGASCNWSSGGRVDDSESVIPHELMHVAQFGLEGPCASIPVWFSEGQAQFVGWNLAIAGTQSLYAESRAYVVDSSLPTRYSSLRELEQYTDEGAEYVIGSLAIELLVAEHGWNSTVDLLSSLNRKTAACASEQSGFEKFETAFETLFGESLDSFSQKVWAYAGLS